jgi:hypothetical protein
MSIPRLDPNYTVEQLHKDAQEFLAAGLRFWEGRAKAGMSGAIAWYKDSNKGMVIFTRGEYSRQLVDNIENQGPVYSFGSSIE